MLGSTAEAEDALQEAWLRLDRRPPDDMADLRPWLTTVVGRICLDMLRTRRSRREDYAGSWLPEPIVEPAGGPNPEHEAILADSVGIALLVVLDTLTPAERLAFVLHDVFAVPFDEIAGIVDRTPAGQSQATPPASSSVPPASRWSSAPSRCRAAESPPSTSSPIRPSSAAFTSKRKGRLRYSAAHVRACPRGTWRWRS